MREATDRCSIHSTPIRSHGLQQDRIREQDRDIISHTTARHQYICLANCYLTHSIANYTCKEAGMKESGIQHSAYKDRDVTKQWLTEKASEIRAATLQGQCLMDSLAVRLIKKTNLTYQRELEIL